MQYANNINPIMIPTIFFNEIETIEGIYDKFNQTPTIHLAGKNYIKLNIPKRKVNPILRSICESLSPGFDVKLDSNFINIKIMG